MTWAVRLIGQGKTYGPFADATTAYAFAAFLTAEVDPADVRPHDPAAGELADPVAELLAWRRHLLRTTTAAPPPADPIRTDGDTTALAAIRHINGDSAVLALAVAAWLGDSPDPRVPVEADRMLAHVAATAHRARALLAREAADINLIRAIGDRP